MHDEKTMRSSDTLAVHQEWNYLRTIVL